MSRILVLGAGMVGSAIAYDLAGRHDVSSADINKEALKKLEKFSITTIHMDLSKFSQISKIVQDYDLIIGAVPGFMGFNTCKAVIESGKNIVDISFFPENAFDLQEIAERNNVFCIVDCGVAPGMDNLILGYHSERMEVKNFICYVGGLPKIRNKPFEYKAPFSPIDVIEEYIRPARYVENGFIVIKEPLSDPEYLEFDNIGTLEAFNTDGLRTLITTMNNIPNMKEKTLRYPGHIEYIKVLKDAGFFSNSEGEIGNYRIKPIDFTSKILFDSWKLKDNEPEFTVMRIIIEGIEQGKKIRYEYNLYDEYDVNTGITSMARTTGYTATAVANLIIDKNPEFRGVIPPEFIGKNQEYIDYIFSYLTDRNVIYRIKKSESH